MKEHVWIYSRGKRLSTMVHKPGAYDKDTPIVICCHGFTGDKIGANQLTTKLATFLEQQGYIVLRFDFLGSGDSDGEFSSDTSVSGWKEDLNNVLDWLNRQAEFSASPVILYGHSLGGMIVLTHNDDDDSKVAGRVVFAPVTNPIANFRDVILGPELWAQSLAGERICNFFAKGFKLECQFVQELVAQGYDPIGSAAKLTTPLLIIHGLDDLAVPIQGSVELYQNYNGSKFIHKPGIDHVATGHDKVIATLVWQWLSVEFPLRSSTAGCIA
jgi:alpha-beta hydrolase superfamily lysophospholipase